MDAARFIARFKERCKQTRWVRIRLSSWAERQASAADHEDTPQLQHPQQTTSRGGSNTQHRDGMRRPASHPTLGNLPYTALAWTSSLTLFGRHFLHDINIRYYCNTRYIKRPTEGISGARYSSTAVVQYPLARSQLSKQCGTRR